jgi:hypothetical protein
MARFIKFPITYRLTHPLPRDRLRLFQDFTIVYRYSMPKLLLSAFVLSSCVFLFPLSALSIGNTINVGNIGLGSVPAVILVVLTLLLGVFIQFYVLYSNIVAASILGEIDLVGILWRYVLMLVSIIFNLEIISVAFLDRHLWESPLNETPFAKLATMTVGLLVSQLIYYRFGRDIAKVKGLKLISSALRRKTISYGLVLSFLVMILFNCFLAPVGSAEELSLVLMISIITAVLILTLYLLWLRTFPRSLPGGRHSERRGRGTFVGSEWEAETEMIFRSTRPSLAVRVALYLGLYLFGFYFMTELAAINQPDSPLLGHMSDDVQAYWIAEEHLSRDTAYGALWTVFFFVILARNRRKGGLFPSRYRLEFVPKGTQI